MYLSIDLDFWSYREPDSSFLSRILKLQVPTLFVNSHEELIPHVDKYGDGDVINLDYHSDLYENSSYEVDTGYVSCGNWLNFVKLKKHLEWRVPRRENAQSFSATSGRCDMFIGRWENMLSGWEKLTLKVGTRGIDLKKVTAVGFARSEEYFDNKEHHDMLMSLFNDLEPCLICEKECFENCRRTLSPRVAHRGPVRASQGAFLPASHSEGT